jgi:hypothetical protein
MGNYGKIEFKISYTVDLDNEAMVEEAMQCVFEDVMNAVKHDEVAEQIKIVPDPAANPQDIPEFLLSISKENDEETSET